MHGRLGSLSRDIPDGLRQTTTVDLSHDSTTDRKTSGAPFLIDGEKIRPFAASAEL
jgi:hypothetical protein